MRAYRIFVNPLFENVGVRMQILSGLNTFQRAIKYTVQELLKTNEMMRGRGGNKIADVVK